MNFVFENLSTFENFTTCNDVNPSTIKRFTPSPVAIAIVRYHQDSDVFKNINFKDVQISNDPKSFQKYIIASGVTHAPHDWCGPDSRGIGLEKNQLDRKNLFSYINKQYLHDLQEGKAFLLLDQSHEGYHVSWLYDWFHFNCVEFKINPKQIIYVTGNLDATEQYSKWADDRRIKDRLCIIPNPHFESAVSEQVLNRIRIHGLEELPDFNKQIAYKEANLEKIKMFNALQKRPRAHRMWLFKELYQNNLLSDSISSMNTFTWNHTFYMNKLMDVLDYDEITKDLPLLPPHTISSDQELTDFSNDDSGKYQMEFNAQITLDTWFTVISEASFGEDTCFISEKTFKLICVHHPFIIYGNKNSLHYLREMGYKTFSPFIDESYDSLECWERLNAIINSIKKIKDIPKEKMLDWYKGMGDILNHNYALMQKNSVTNAPQAMISISEYFNRD
jgi:hypothetical protein